MNYSKRRIQIVNNLPEKSVVFIPAAQLVQESMDVEYPFRQNSNFWYLTGIDEPDCLLMLAPSHPDSEMREVLFIPEQTELTRTWHGGGIDEATAQKISGIASVLRSNDKVDTARGVLEWADNVYTPHGPTKRDVELFITDPEPQLRQWLKRYGAKTIDNITPALMEARMVKDSLEIAALEDAVRVTHEAFQALKPLMKPGVYEYDLEAAAHATIKRSNFEWGYLPIIGSGPNSCVLHSFKNTRQLQNNEPLLIDIGARRNYYSADITRSYWVGEQNEQYERLHSVVAQLQQFAISVVQPGKTMRDLVYSFREALLAQLKQLGLLGSEATIRDTVEYMPHGISHHLGVDLHDLADYTKPFRPGNVIMIEPGIYLKEQGIGVRIEDGVVVTDNGCRLLGE